MPGRDEAEFAEFTARDGGRLLGFAVLLTGDWQDAEDLVQMALLRSASHWSAARQRPEGYARAVLVNLARDRWRSRRRHHAELSADELAYLTPTAAGDIAAAVLDRQMLLRACRLLPAIDSTGSHLLVSCDRFGRLDRARFTPLPGSAPQTTVAAAW